MAEHTPGRLLELLEEASVEHAGDGRLIAAQELAEELEADKNRLLEVCKGMVEAIDRWSQKFPLVHAGDHHAYDALLAAIAKAEGEE